MPARPAGHAGANGHRSCRGEFSPFVYTEHRAVDTIDATPATGQGISGSENSSSAEEAPASAEPVWPPRVAGSPLPTVERTVPLGAIAASAHAALTAVSELVVEPGDTVVVRFDDNRIRRFRLSTDTHSPEDGVVHISQPIGLALLGNGVEDEVECLVDEKPRLVVIEKIAKASALELTD